MKQLIYLLLFLTTSHAHKLGPSHSLSNRWTPSPITHLQPHSSIATTLRGGESDPPKKRRKRRTGKSESENVERVKNPLHKEVPVLDERGKSKKRSFVSKMFNGPVENDDPVVSNKAASGGRRRKRRGSLDETSEAAATFSEGESDASAVHATNITIKCHVGERSKAPEKKRKRRKRKDAINGDDVSVDFNGAEIGGGSETYSGAIDGGSAKKRKRKRRALGAGSSSTVPFQTGDMDREADASTDLTGTVEINGESTGRKRKRRESISHPTSRFVETNDTVSRNEQTNVEQTEGRNNSIDVPELTENIKELPIVNSTSTTTDATKKKRKRKKIKSSAAVESIEANVKEEQVAASALETAAMDATKKEIEVDTTEEQMQFSTSSNAPIKAYKPAQSSISINITIDIPNEEVMPESVFSAVEVDHGLSVAGAEDEVDKSISTEVSLELSDVVVSKDMTIQKDSELIEGDGHTESPAEETQTQSTDEAIHESVDNHAGLFANETKFNTVRQDELPLQTLSVETPIHIPDEEVVPESVFSSLEVHDGLHDAEMNESEAVTNGIKGVVSAWEVDSDAEIGGSVVDSLVLDNTRQEVEVVESDAIELNVEQTSDQSAGFEAGDKTANVPMADEDEIVRSEIDVTSDACVQENVEVESDAIEHNVDELEERTVDENTVVEAGNVTANVPEADKDGSERSERDVTSDACVQEDAGESDSQSVDSFVNGSLIEEVSNIADVDAETGSNSMDEEITDVVMASMSPDSFDGLQIDATPENEPAQSSSEISEKAVQDSFKVKNDEDANKLDNDCLVLSVVTWNLGEAAPSEKEASFIRRFQKSDLVMIGAQECEDIKPRRSEGHRSRHLRRLGIQMLGEQFVPIAIHSLGGIQLALYCRRDRLGDVEFIHLADVTCGLGNVLHNKGAIGVYLKMRRRSQGSESVKSSKILLVTGHLAAHVKNVDARNADFKRIVTELEAQAPARFLRPKKNSDGSLVQGDGTYLLNSMDTIIFSGDLNYRIDLPREFVDRCIHDIKECQEQHNSNTDSKKIDALMNKLLRHDQLLRTITSGRAFSQFSEGNIAFLPTFKFDKGSSQYDTSYKQRIPAWTDRILFKSSRIRVLDYDSVASAMHSDHRPVYGTYQLGWGSISSQEKSKPKRKKRR